MNIQRKMQKGITLIALVISIIVMLILAGVSLNATVGENGIITKAQEANIISGVATLEEFLNLEYVKYYDYKEDGMTAVDLLKEKTPKYFFSINQGYVSDSQNHKLYLIDKSGLPDEIREQLAGGNATTKSAYFNLEDVYGVTSNLKVYYCSKGIESLFGISTDELDSSNPAGEVFGTDTLLAKLINGTNEDGTAVSNLTTEDVKKITSLTIDTAEKVSLLSEINKLPNLIKIYITGLSNIDLSQIAENINVDEVRIETCSVSNYSGLKNLKGLNKLYLIRPSGYNEDIINLGSRTVGIGEIDFINLEYLGIVGQRYNIQSLRRADSNHECYDGNYPQNCRFNLTNINALENLSGKTKENIKFLYLNNLNLNSISCLSEFSGCLILRVDYNNLLTLDGIQGMTKLLYLFSAYQGSNFGKNDGLLAGYNLEEGTENLDALQYISNCTSLSFIDLAMNSNIKWVKYISNCENLENLYLNGCTSIKDLGELSNVIGKCSSASYEGSLAKSLISNEVKVLDLTNTKITKDEFEKLKGNYDASTGKYTNNTALEALNLTNTNILKSIDNNGNETVLTNDEYNEMIRDVLSKCTSMKYLKLDDQSKLNNIDFVNTMPNLKDLHLLGCTNLIDLTLLENLTENGKINLNSLFLSNTSIQLNTIQKTISSLGCDMRRYRDENGKVSYSGYQSFWYSREVISDSDTLFGLVLTNDSLWNQISGCTSITRICSFYGWRGYVSNGSGGGALDLTSCVNLTDFSIYCYRRDFILPTSLKHCYTGHGGCVNLLNCFNLETLILNTLNDSSALRFKVLDSLPESYIKLKYLSVQEQSENVGLSEYNKISKFNYYTDFVEFELEKQNDRSSCYLNDISFIENMKSLKKITIKLSSDLYDEYTIPDLSEFTNLENITISYGRNLNLNNIKTASNLKSVTINNLPSIKNTDFLDGLNLEYVNLSNCEIKDLSGLESSKNTLETCILSKNAITDIYSLVGCNKLTELYLDNNKLGDFGFHRFFFL